MRRVLTVAATAVLATAAVAGAAPARPFSFADAAGDADLTGGRVAAASQASYDVLRVTLSPHARTKRTSAIAVRIDLAAPLAATPGTAFYVSGTQHGCTFTMTRSLVAEGWIDSWLSSCDLPTRGTYTSRSVDPAPAPTGRSVTFVVPERALVDSRLGARITSIDVGTALGDPATGVPSPVHVDSATHAGPYTVGR